MEALSAVLVEVQFPLGLLVEACEGAQASAHAQPDLAQLLVVDPGLHAHLVPGVGHAALRPQDLLGVLVHLQVDAVDALGREEPVVALVLCQRLIEDLRTGRVVSRAVAGEEPDHWTRGPHTQLRSTPTRT